MPFPLRGWRPRTRKFIEANGGASGKAIFRMWSMFRALVMMVFLIAIPLVALFGTSLPDAIKAVKEGRWPTLTGMAQAFLSTHAPNPKPRPEPAPKYLR